MESKDIIREGVFLGERGEGEGRGWSVRGGKRDVFRPRARLVDESFKFNI